MYSSCIFVEIGTNILDHSSDFKETFKVENLS